MPNYQTNSITSVLEIPSLIGAFADSVGWSTDLSVPDQPIVTHPTLGGAVNFRCTASIGGTNNQDHVVQWAAVSDAAITSSARIASPKLNGSSTALPNVPLPTALHLFGDVTGEPYLAAVVRYAGGFYRHLYFGYMNKVGNYAGGEVISGSTPFAAYVSSMHYANSQHAYLFSGYQKMFSDAQCGGVRVAHLDNPTTWRRFKTPASSPQTIDSLQENVLGGFRDSINTTYLQAGLSNHANATVLVPIHLYVNRASGRISPIGHPEGVRLVRMDNILPEQSVSVGGSTWKVFPQFFRSFSTATVDGTFYMADETSYLIGLAYPEE